MRQGIHWIAFSVSWVLVPTTLVIMVSCMVTAKYTYERNDLNAYSAKILLLKYFIWIEKKTSNILFVWSLLRHGVYWIFEFGDANKKFIDFKGLNVFCRQKIKSSESDYKFKIYL